MIRKFNLVIFDNEDKIIDRLKLNITTNINVGGIKIALNVISTEVEDIITKVIQTKQDIKFNILMERGYLESGAVSAWIEKYTRPEYIMALEYISPQLTKYAVGKVISLSKTELDEFKVMERSLTFRPTTPFFQRIENLIKIQTSAFGKFYPFKYPYSYGQNVIENNEIENTYIADIPLIIRVNGAITNPSIQLLDSDGNSYNRVDFSNVTLNSDQHLIINSGTKKILFWNGSEYVDYTPEVNPMYDTFLLAQPGKSTLSINLNPADDGYIIGGWRQYGVDS